MNIFSAVKLFREGLQTVKEFYRRYRINALKVTVKVPDSRELSSIRLSGGGWDPDRVEVECNSSLTPVPKNTTLDDWNIWVEINKRELAERNIRGNESGPDIP